MQLNELEKELNNLDRNILKYLIFSLMIKEKISYKELSERYVEYLENKDNNNRILISGLSIPLSAYIQGGKLSKRLFYKAKGAYHLLNSGVFKTSEFEKELLKIVEETGYEEDEHGNPVKFIG